MEQRGYSAGQFARTAFFAAPLEFCVATATQVDWSTLHPYMSLFLCVPVCGDKNKCRGCAEPQLKHQPRVWTSEPIEELTQQNSLLGHIWQRVRATWVRHCKSREGREQGREKGLPHHPSTIIIPCRCFAKLLCVQHQPQISYPCPLKAFLASFHAVQVSPFHKAEHSHW